MNDIRIWYNRLLLEVHPTQMTQIRAEILKLVETNNHFIHVTRYKILELVNIPGESQVVKRNQQVYLAKRLMDVVMDLQIVKSETKAKYFINITKSIRTSFPQLTQEHIDRIVASRENSDAQDPVFEGKTEAINNINARKQDIANIEQFLRDLQPVVHDMEHVMADHDGPFEHDETNDNSYVHLENASCKGVSISNVCSARKRRIFIIAITISSMIIIGVSLYFGLRAVLGTKR